jgi:hypothetical protein
MILLIAVNRTPVVNSVNSRHTDGAIEAPTGNVPDAINRHNGGLVCCSGHLCLFSSDREALPVRCSCALKLLPYSQEPLSGSGTARPLLMRTETTALLSGATIRVNGGGM